MKLKFLSYILTICCIFSTIGCTTGVRMVDQTYLNADKNVWSYEQFQMQYANYKQYQNRIKDAEFELEKENNKMEQKDTENVKRINIRIAGYKDMKRNIAANYNAMSRIHYQSIWKSSDLPQELGED